MASTFSIESIGSTLGLGSADLKSTTINILEWSLGILALAAVSMIILGIFIVASSGDSDRGERARRLIAGAIMGLIIVLLAWAIVIFVANTTANVTQ